MKKQKRKKKSRAKQVPPVCSTGGFPPQNTNDGALAFTPTRTLLLIPERQQTAAQSPAGTTRPNYRSSRVTKDNKKLINVPVDKELKLNARVLMSTERLTWETLIEKLLLQWVESHPKYPKLLERRPPQ